MKEIDFENWKRKEFFNFYSLGGISRYYVTTNLEITKVYDFAHKNKLSFYFALQHIFMTAIKGIEEFNISIENGKLIVKDGIYSSCTYLKKGESIFNIVDVPYTTNIIEFCQNAQEKAEAQKVFKENTDYNKIFCIFSCIPWFEFSNMENPKISNNDDFTPKIVWDKIKKIGNKKFVNVCIDVNHRVIDGYLIAQLLESVKNLISKL